MLGVMEQNIHCHQSAIRLRDSSGFGNQMCILFVNSNTDATVARAFTVPENFEIFSRGAHESIATRFLQSTEIDLILHQRNIEIVECFISEKSPAIQGPIRVLSVLFRARFSMRGA